MGLAKEFHKRKQSLILQNLDEKWHSMIATENVSYSQTEQTLRNMIVNQNIRKRCLRFISSDETTNNTKQTTDPLIACTELKELN